MMAKLGYCGINVLCGGQLNVRGVSNFDGSLGDNFVGNWFEEL